MIKNELPEMTGYLTHGVDPSKAASMVHRESTQMADVLVEHALLTRWSVLVDGSLRDHEYHSKLFERIRKEAPDYRAAIVHVTANDDVVRKRMAERIARTGRDAPDGLLEETMVRVPRSVDALGPRADVCVTISNNPEGMRIEWTLVDGKDPFLQDDEEEAKEEGGPWARFREPWHENDDHDDSRLCGPLLRCMGDAVEDASILCTPSTMPESWSDERAHEAASRTWGAAYPNSCARCTLTCDGQCGVCIHGRHFCACDDCRGQSEWKLQQRGKE